MVVIACNPKASIEGLKEKNVAGGSGTHLWRQEEFCEFEASLVFIANKCQASQGDRVRPFPKTINEEAGKSGPWWRASATYKGANSYLQPQSQGVQGPLLTSTGNAHM